MMNNQEENIDRNLGALLKSRQVPTPEGLNARIMMRVAHADRRRRGWRNAWGVCGGILLALLVLAVTTAVFLFAARMAGLGDWLKAVDDYVTAGFEYLRMTASSFTVRLIVAVAVMSVAVRVGVWLFARRRQTDRM